MALCGFKRTLIFPGKIVKKPCLCVADASRVCEGDSRRLSGNRGRRGRRPRGRLEGDQSDSRATHTRPSVAGGAGRSLMRAVVLHALALVLLLCVSRSATSPAAPVSPAPALRSALSSSEPMSEDEKHIQSAERHADVLARLSKIRHLINYKSVS